MPAPEDLWKDVSRVPAKLRSAPRRKRSSGVLAAILVVGSLLLATAGLVYLEFQSDQPADGVALGPNKDLRSNDELPNTARAQAPKADSASPPPREKKPPHSPPPETQASAEPMQSTPPVAAEDDSRETVQLSDEAAQQPPKPAIRPETQKRPAPPDDKTIAQRDAAYARAVTRAGAALVARDLDRASRLLEVAEGNVRSPDQLAQVKQLRATAQQLGHFFDAVRAGLQKYQPAEEVNIDGLVAAIVEVRPDGVALFVEGSKRDYSIATMPANMALFFARAAANEDQPSAALFFGAFYAVDPQGDRDKARRLWNRAAAADLAVDDLLPLLDGPPLASRREPVPDAELVDAAATRVQGPLADLIVTAQSGPRKSLVAKKLLEAARGADNSPEQYAALAQARDWAVSAGDPATALAALDELGRWFDVDSLELKSQALGAALAGRVTSKSRILAATRALELSAEAERAGRDELALTLADTAYTAARMARDSALTKRAYRRRSQMSKKVKAGGRSRSSPREKR